MPDHDDNFWGEPIHSYSRAQAIADGLLVDLTTATDDCGQLLCKEAGFKVPVAITRAAWTQTIEPGGCWKPHAQGQILQLPGGQSLTGRLWDVMWMLRVACDKSPPSDRIHFEVLVDVYGDGERELVKLWALCGPGDDIRPVITIMLEGDD